MSTGRTTVLLRDVAVEGVGTFVLVTSVCLASALYSKFVFLPAMTGGMALLALMLAFRGKGPLHFNPAVTLGMFVCNEVRSLTEVACLVAAQFLAAVPAAYFVMHIMAPFSPAVGATTIQAGLTPWTAFLLEIFVSFVLMTAALTSNPTWQPLAVAAAATCGGFLAGDLTGGSMNPARSFGPAFVTGQVENLWVYLCGPFVGCVSAAFFMVFAVGREPVTEEPERPSKFLVMD